MSIATELNRIISAKNNLKEQLLNKGIQVNNEKLDEYQYFVDAVHSPFPAVTHPYRGDANLDLVRLQYSKDALKESINNKGGNITNELISSYYLKLRGLGYVSRFTANDTSINEVIINGEEDSYNIWTDGTNILYTYNGVTKNLLTGDEVVWNGENIPQYGMYIWMGGGEIFYSDSDNSEQYVYNSSTNEWEINTNFNDLDVDARRIWIDKDNDIFLTSEGYYKNYQYDSSSRTFNVATFFDSLGNILNTQDFYKSVWIDNDIYFYDIDELIIYKKTSTFTWEKFIENYNPDYKGFFVSPEIGWCVMSDYYSGSTSGNGVYIFHKSTFRFEKLSDHPYGPYDLLHSFPYKINRLFTTNPGRNHKLSTRASTFGTIRSINPSELYFYHYVYISNNYYKQMALSDTPAKTTDFVEYSTITNTPSGNVNAFWSDGIYVYNSNNSTSGKVFNKSTNTWDSITWNKSIDGNRIWTDGVDIYCDYNNYNNHYKLNKSTMQWEDHSWNISNLDGSNVWTLNGEYYYDGTVYSSKLNKNTMEWENRYDNGSISVGYAVWTDGKRVFYSNGSGSSNQKELTINSDNTFTWTNKTWTGLSSFFAYQFLWTDGTNIFYDYNATHKILDLATDTWVNNTWSNVNPANRNIFSVNPNKNFLCLLKAKTFTQDRNIHPEDIIIYSGSTNYQLQKS